MSEQATEETRSACISRNVSCGTGACEIQASGKQYRWPRGGAGGARAAARPYGRGRATPRHQSITAVRTTTSEQTRDVEAGAERNAQAAPAEEASYRTLFMFI